MSHAFVTMHASLALFPCLSHVEISIAIRAMEQNLVVLPNKVSLYFAFSDSLKSDLFVQETDCECSSSSTL